MTRDYEAYLEDWTFENYWQALNDIGWIEWIPSENVDDLKVRLESSFDRDPAWAFPALATTGFDAECIYDTEPDGLSYQRKLLQLAEYSSGVFTPEHIVDNFDSVAKRHVVGFSLGGDTFSTEVEFGSKWFDISVIDLVNIALSKLGTPLRYIEIPTRDQILLLCLIPEDVFIESLARGLIPPLKYYWYKEYRPDLLDQYLNEYYQALEVVGSVKQLNNIGFN